MKKLNSLFILLIFPFLKCSRLRAKFALKTIYLSLIISLTMIFGLSSLKAQINSGAISLSPQDTTICPLQTIKLNGSFTSFIDTLHVDDQFSHSKIDIGFPFVFYGETYTKCVLSGNGFLSFDTTWVGMGSSYIYSIASTNGQLDNTIMMPFQDLNTNTGGQIATQTYGQAPNRIFVVEFCKVPYFSITCSSLLFTGQIILHETSNLIEIQIGNKEVCTTWQNGAAIEGLRKTSTIMDLVPGRDNAAVQWTAANDARLFTPLSATSYKIDTIPYNPRILIQNANAANIKWFEEGNPLSIGQGGQITVTPTANINYYYAQIYGQNGCLGTQNYTFQDTVWIHYGVTRDTFDVDICAGTSYNWLGHTLFASGNYDTLLYNHMGCDSFQRLRLHVNPLPDAAVKGSNRLGICATDSVILNTSGAETGVAYQWYKDGSGIPGATSFRYVVNQGGVYKLIAVSDKGCTSASREFIVVVNPNPVATILPLANDVMCTYDTVQLTAAAGQSYDYVWSPAKPFRAVTGSEGQQVRGVFSDLSTEVTLRVYNEYGCYDLDTVTVFTKPCCEVFSPSAFTPNGDGLNDYFNPALKPEQIILACKIYDRYGKLVYDNADLKHGWDGRYPNGEEANAGTYMYSIKYTCADGTKKATLH